MSNIFNFGTIGNNNNTRKNTSIFSSDGVTVTTNGQTFTGKNITICGGKMIIDGKDVKNDVSDSMVYNFVLSGNIDSIQGDIGKIEVHGNVGSIDSTNTKIITGTVSGNIQTTNDSVNVSGHVSGSIQTTNAPITVQGNVKGSVKTTNAEINIYNKN